MYNPPCRSDALGEGEGNLWEKVKSLNDYVQGFILIRLII